MFFAASPPLVEIAGYAGFDFAVLDLEHSAATSGAALVDMLRAADAAGLPVLVRVPACDATVIRHAMESGAQGIVVPHVRSRQEAEAAVACVRFPLQGQRGYAGASVRATGYGLRVSGAAYKDATDAGAVVLAMAEDDAFFDAADDILSVEGISGVFFGPADYAISRGLAIGSAEAGQATSARAADAVRLAVRHGKVSMGSAAGVGRESLQALVAQGHQLVLAGSDVGLFADLCRGARQAMDGVRAGH
ncbi:MAG TPA: aldolase/citrate lyase family protein [Ramlibacter sp.]|nr:aldolase/citrate lyase family protein [Ramlibacter sp.]